MSKLFMAESKNHISDKPSEHDELIVALDKAAATLGPLRFQQYRGTRLAFLKARVAIKWLPTISDHWPFSWVTIRIGDILIKRGGPNRVRLTEVLTMDVIARNTSIPVPRIHGVHQTGEVTWIVMA